MKEYAILGFVENDESRPNTEVLEFLSAETDEEAIKKFNELDPTEDDFLTGEGMEIVKSRLVELREVSR